MGWSSVVDQVTGNCRIIGLNIDYSDEVAAGEEVAELATPPPEAPDQAAVPTHARKPKAPGLLRRNGDALEDRP